MNYEEEVQAEIDSRFPIFDTDTFEERQLKRDKIILFLLGVGWHINYQLKK